ncbi:MAG TPA: HD domain-containing phosphohydrolase, partial [Bacillota bacterium]|nr:HD domain-containing phosphohydrolase [Bacillota bacterium]
MEWPESYFNMSLDICMYHHERHNGKGYPMGLVGDEIPISAQIVSIADCFDALTSKRVYKAAYTPEKAYDMMQGGECGVFSPKLLKSLENCKNAMFACAGSGRQETGHFAASYDTIPGLEGIRVLLV